ncbi:TonB-dependent receptor plug domain-containing protein [Larkinella terrae]|uniref:TonB-dependent receptor plug domain-containing protein n=1 Tax=Larkinella terrae TaxID=2025311 RepID=A0A7K0EUQ1_9BACT|nr:TonB-dependent receptor plug domain-containing protein [Larkinella terrae]MRS65545.1 TonB-dependent receptor plug domain-containing protein [Larkinella terrae]
MNLLLVSFRRLGGMVVVPVLLALGFVADDFPTRLFDRFRAYHTAYPKEKVYVQTDKPYYTVGETVWMKGYLFDGPEHLADSISKVLYVDLLQLESRKVVVHRILRAENGYAVGDIALGDSLAAGGYVLRAYTGWMRNFAEDYFFTKPLTILHTDSEPAQLGNDKPLTARPDVQFFPEGGQLVNGMEGRIAFKTVSPAGKGLTASGFVLSSAGDTVTGFSTKHLGMGYFSMTPETGQHYTAFVKLDDGSTHKFPIPDARPEGYVLLVDNITNRDNVRVYIRNNKPSSTQGRFTVIAQSRGVSIQIAQGDVSKKSVVLQIPRQLFPEGIAQITLFDETNQPVGERLVFSERNNRLTVHLKPSKAVFSPREKIQLDITVSDASGKPVRTNLSLAATDAHQVLEKEPYAASLASYLLLSSDLKGVIEQPGYYFDPANNERLSDLDVLMMTQGWRRFVWKDVLQDTYPAPKHLVEQGLVLAGKVVRPNQKAPGTVALTFMLMRRDSTQNILSGESDENGQFSVNGLDYSDSTRVMIQAVMGKNNRNLEISLENLASPTVTWTQIPYKPIVFQRDELADYLKRAKEYLDIERQIRRNREIMLKEVTIRKKKEAPTDSRKIYGQASNTLKVDQTMTGGAQSVLQMLQGRIAGVNISGSPMNPTVQIRGSANFAGVVEPLFTIDGVPVSKDAVLTLSVYDVDYIDVLKGAAATIFGSRASGGVIAVYTKRGSPDYDYSKDKSPGTLVATLPGFRTVREFYAPRYDEPKPEHVRPDYRPTLHWAPMIQTDADGKAQVTFFASDARTTIHVLAEGATTNGLPGVGKAVLEVK